MTQKKFKHLSDVKFCDSEEKFRFVKLVARPSGGELGRIPLTGPSKLASLHFYTLLRNMLWKIYL